MDSPFILARHPSADRRASFGRPRVKTGHLTLGATRSRMVQVVRHLGIYRERIAARLREEEFTDEERRSRELARGPRGPVASGEPGTGRRVEEERLGRSIELHQFVPMLRDELRYESMTEEEKAAERWEEEVLAWLTNDEAVEGGP